MTQNKSLRGGKSRPGGAKISPGGAAAPPLPAPMVYTAVAKLKIFNRQITKRLCGDHRSLPR